jgi:hypothetical protein
MQKRNRSRKMSGGFLDSLSSSISSGWNSLSQGASNAWNKTKTATSNAYASATGSSTPSTYTSTASVTPTYTTGGKRKSKKMRGGYHPNSSTTNLASSASSISGIKTAQPHNWVGGKTRRHRKHKHKHSRSCRHKKH